VKSYISTTRPIGYLHPAWFQPEQKRLQSPGPLAAGHNTYKDLLLQPARPAPASVPQAARVGSGQHNPSAAARREAGREDDHGVHLRELPRSPRQAHQGTGQECTPAAAAEDCTYKTSTP